MTKNNDAQPTPASEAAHTELRRAPANASDPDGVSGEEASIAEPTPAPRAKVMPPELDDDGDDLFNDLPL